jgi:hypothetical protein
VKGKPGDVAVLAMLAKTDSNLLNKSCFTKFAAGDHARCSKWPIMTQ